MREAFEKRIFFFLLSQRRDMNEEREYLGCSWALLRACKHQTLRREGYKAEVIEMAHGR